MKHLKYLLLTISALIILSLHYCNIIKKDKLLSVPMSHQTKIDKTNYMNNIKWKTDNLSHTTFKTNSSFKGIKRFTSHQHPSLLSTKSSSSNMFQNINNFSNTTNVYTNARATDNGTNSSNYNIQFNNFKNNINTSNLIAQNTFINSSMQKVGPPTGTTADEMILPAMPIKADFIYFSILILIFGAYKFKTNS